MNAPTTNPDPAPAATGVADDPVPAGPGPESPALSRSERDTLKAIWRLTAGAGTADAARTGDLATALGLSPGTVTTLVKRLADRGMATYTPYRGVELRGEGHRLAMGVIRRHRIVERFLADLLHYSWAEADRLAPTFEHELPQEVEDRLWVALDRPTTCPHGFPIPGLDTDELPAMPALYDLDPGAVATVALPGSIDPDVAAFLDGLGVRPGARVHVIDKLPFDGPLVLAVEGATGELGEPVTIGDKLAHLILVGTSTGEAHGAGGPRPTGAPPTT